MKYKYEINVDISQFTDEELIKIYDDLTSWRWSPILGKQPDWWDNSPDFLVGHFKKIREKYIPNKSCAINHIITDIQDLIGTYRLMQYHWINNLGRTKEEYDTWILSKCAELTRFI